MRALFILSLLAGCGGGADRGIAEPVHLEGTVIRPPRDTARFALPAKLRMCEGRRAALLESVDPRGDGVLTLIRFGDGDGLVARTYPILMPGDTQSPGAVVGIRYLIRDLPHSLTLDTGFLELRFERSRVTARVAGSGVENAVRTRATLDYRDVAPPIAGDSVPCRYGR